MTRAGFLTITEPHVRRMGAHLRQIGLSDVQDLESKTKRVFKKNGC